MKKRGDVNGVIQSLAIEARDLSIGIAIRSCDNGKCLRSAQRLEEIAEEMLKIFKERKEESLNLEELNRGH